MASPLCVEILEEIYVIMNVLWSVVQSLCSCVQIELEKVETKEGCCVSLSYICLWRLC